MATIRQIRRRIRSITNTAKITKAMELVAASKMRRAQQRALAARPYAERMRGTLADLVTRDIKGDPVHPLLEVRPVERVLLLQLTPDRGLCGGLNTHMNRYAASLALEQEAEVSLVCVGRKGRDFFARSGYPLVAEFTELGDYPEMADVLPIARTVMDEFRKGAADRVYLVFPLFVNTVTQTPTARLILPAEPPEAEEVPDLDYIYEPSPETVLGELLPRYVEMQVYEAILETSASEQSARMVAMRNATDAANEMIEELTLIYNKARQEQITKELLDIVGGAAALVEK
jgi:F-type H+-transporting ATPase subunit gamma